MSNTGTEESDIKLPIKKSDDEYVIKDYRAAKIKKPEKGEAHIVVTNRRAIIYFWTHKVVLVNDAHITEITSTDIFWTKRSRHLAGAILLAISVIGYLILFQQNLNLEYNLQNYLNDPYYENYNPYYEDYISSQRSFLIVIGIILAIPAILGIYLLLKERTTFVITLYIKSVTGAMTLHNYPSSEGGVSGKVAGLLKPAQLKIEGKPGPDAELLAKEIGAIILDIQRGIIKK
jgi:hypothetical protein